MSPSLNSTGMKYFAALIIALWWLSPNAQSQTDSTYVWSIADAESLDSLLSQWADTTPVEILPDDPILAALDRLWAEKRIQWQCFEDDTLCLNKYNYMWNEVPGYPDSVLMARLAKLNAATPLELTYNKHVKAFINLYAVKKRELTSRVLGLAALYYPLFEEKLDLFDMPMELKHLAVVESALYAPAKSKAGAAGLWQFMYATGRMYGLEVDSYYDDRLDPIKSTIAACRYMKYLYRLYGDWNLVLAAYNSGPGNVNKAIRKAGGKKDYWAIWDYLPLETRGYVPAFIAVNYIMNHATEHNLYPVKPAYLFGEVDTIHVCGPARLDQIAYFAGISVEHAQLLNPSLKRGEIPKSDRCKAIYLPVERIGNYLANQDRLHEYKPAKQEVVLTPAPLAEAKPHLTHTVKAGETLGLIASRHKVTIGQLRQWNNLKSDQLRVGQKISIHSQQGGASQSSSVVKSGTNIAGSSALRYHTVQAGDTLWDIARKYPGISITDLKEANKEQNLNNLRIGQKIKIPAT